eukprot:8249629-Lingulodinium_polyedra.AAC.1
MASGMLPSSLARSASSVRANGWAYASSCCANSIALAGGGAFCALSSPPARPVPRWRSGPVA